MEKRTPVIVGDILFNNGVGERLATRAETEAMPSFIVMRDVAADDMVISRDIHTISFVRATVIVDAVIQNLDIVAIPPTSENCHTDIMMNL